ncbi:MAG TPA: L-threonylcarbamoyladenylate synthase [Candidatus Limnocylindrales bacterium]|nr:L-threonylcarbamoyladenylate synthase [Candidatus Limnocylindrales bacterium]
MTARIVPDDDAGRAEAVAVLRSGGVVALPTDTVYGIAVDLATPGGVERLFAAKRRPPDKGIMLLLSDASQADEVGVVGVAARALATAFWPGGLTLVVPRRPDVELPAALTAGTPTVGLRLPDHAAPRALAAAVGPIPTTSANRSGQPEGRDAVDIVDQIGDAIDLVLDGGAAHGGPASTVVDCTGDRPRILRAGAVAPDAVAAVLGAAGVSLDPGDRG